MLKKIAISGKHAPKFFGIIGGFALFFEKIRPKWEMTQQVQPIRVGYFVFIPFEKVVAISFSWLTWVRGSQRHVFKQHLATCHIPMQYFFANIMVNVIFYTSPLLSTSMNDFSRPPTILIIVEVKAFIFCHILQTILRLHFYTTRKEVEQKFNF